MLISELKIDKDVITAPCVYRVLSELLSEDNISELIVHLLSNYSDSKNTRTDNTAASNFCINRDANYVTENIYSLHLFSRETKGKLFYSIDLYKGSESLFKLEFRGYDKTPDVSVVSALRSAFSVLLADIEFNKENLK